MPIALSSIAVSPTRSVLTIGSKGSTVRQLQRNLNARFQALQVVTLAAVLVDGYFGNETLMAVKYLQCVGGLPVNGRVDKTTWRFAEEGVRGLPVLYIGSESTCVAAAQKSVVDVGIPIRIDGFYGEQTMQAVETYQQKMGLKTTGMVGFETWKRVVRSRLVDLPCAALLPNPYQQ